MSHYEYRVNVIRDTDSPKRWREFTARDMESWKPWAGKWIIQNRNRNTLFVRYDDFLSRPFYVGQKAILFMNSKEKIDEDHLKKCVKAEGIEEFARRDIRAFKYYDEDSLRELEAGAWDKMRSLGFKPYFI